MDKNKRVVPNSKDNSCTLRLRGVRLSFPNLFKAHAFQEGQEPKFGATFIMPKEGDKEQNYALAKEAVAAVVAMAFKGKSPASDKLCLRDGATKPEVDGYGDEVMFLSSNCAKRPTIVDVDLSDLDEASGKPYAGCFVNCTVRLWAQDNKYGRRVNAQLRAVQFLRDGEPFGDSRADAEEEFEPVVDGDVL